MAAKVVRMIADVVGATSKTAGNDIKIECHVQRGENDCQSGENDFNSGGNCLKGDGNYLNTKL